MTCRPLLFMLFAVSVCHSAMANGIVGICSALTQRKYPVLQLPACSSSVIPCFQPFSYSHVGNGTARVTRHSAGQEFAWHRLIYTGRSTYKSVNGYAVGRYYGSIICVTNVSICTCIYIYIYRYTIRFIVRLCVTTVQYAWWRQPIKATSQQSSLCHRIYLIIRLITFMK